jgi:hypothetical protein
MVLDHAEKHESQSATIRSIAEKIGCTAETLRSWVRQAERDTGRRLGLTTDERRRADLRGAADRPIDLLRNQGPGARPRCRAAAADGRPLHRQQLMRHLGLQGAVRPDENDNFMNVPNSRPG